MAGTKFVTLMPIKNMNRAIRFYTKTLGAKMGERGMGEMKDSWASVRIGKHDIWLIRGGSEKRKLAYSTFLVPNIKRFVAKLTQRKVKFEKAEALGPETRVAGPIAYEPFGASAFFKDTEGNLLMVWQNAVPM